MCRLRVAFMFISAFYVARERTRASFTASTFGLRLCLSLLS